jgi:glycosyltransferase involved in cell wall biosynthesis
MIVSERRQQVEARAANRLRIAMLCTPLVTAGGAERQFLEEVRSLRALGHDVTVLTFRLSDEALFVDGVGRKDIEVLRARGGWGGQILALRLALKRLRPHLLVSHTSPELTWLATRGSGVRYVQYHNSPPFYIGEAANPYMASSRYRRVFPRVREGAAGYAAFAEPPRMGLRRRIESELRTALKHRALRDAMAVIVPSERTVRELRLLHGVEATVVRGCLPASVLRECVSHARASSPLVLSVCRLDAVKRIDLLLRAFPRVLREVPDARLDIAGKGPERERLESLARALGIAGRVRFLGYVPEDALWECYARADVFAAPAMADFNIAPYEALAAGCKTVWTTEMETEASIEASGRVFVAAPEEEAFARAIIDALRAPSGAPIDLSAMTWDGRARKLDAIYEGLASGVAA